MQTSIGKQMENGVRIARNVRACNANKTNDWWVLFEAEFGRAVWMGRIEDAETEHS